MQMTKWWMLFLRTVQANHILCKMLHQRAAHRNSIVVYSVTLWQGVTVDPSPTEKKPFYASKQESRTMQLTNTLN